MLLVIFGAALLLAWAMVWVIFRRVWRLWRSAPPCRVADVHSAQLVRISGQARPRSEERVLAPLSGKPALFFSFEGMTSVAELHRAAHSGQTILRRAGVPFLVDDGSGVLALLGSPERLRGSAAQPFTVIEWSKPEEVAAIEQRLGQSFGRYRRLQGKELVVTEGSPITLLARAERQGELVMLTPAADDNIFLWAGAEASTRQAMASGRRMLRGLLAAGVLLVSCGLGWSFLMS